MLLQAGRHRKLSSLSDVQVWKWEPLDWSQIWKHKPDNPTQIEATGAIFLFCKLDDRESSAPSITALILYLNPICVSTSVIYWEGGLLGFVSPVRGL